MPPWCTTLSPDRCLYAGKGKGAWLKEVLPGADLIFDHFHWVKLMNDKLSNLRRSTMKKTIGTHIEGILDHWRHGSFTNVSHEGLNNKIDRLTRQAHGYRNEEYLHLRSMTCRIYQNAGTCKTHFREELFFYAHVPLKHPTVPIIASVSKKTPHCSHQSVRLRTRA